MAKVAFIVDRSFDDELFQTAFDCVRQAGHEVVIVGTEAGVSVHGHRGKIHVTADVSVDEFKELEGIDAALIPAGTPRNHLRTHERILNFLRDVYAEGKPVGVMRDDGYVITRGDVKAKGLATWPTVKRGLLLESMSELRGDDVLRDHLIISANGGPNTFCDDLLSQLECAGLETSGFPHEHVDMLDEQVVDNATGAAPLVD